jgi:lipopolysaccharide transport system ATP-binding protein
MPSRAAKRHLRTLSNFRMPTIITAENLRKKYQIGADKSARYLRDTLGGFLKTPLSHARKNGKPDDRTIWALKDVSFDVQQGEIVGLIGRNGAGKSTLLKIVSRITEPTAGRVRLRGRVGSLLEVGTGFHPELTGRENIFLNGAVMGMKRSEIALRFNEIVDFAGIGRLLDTPVKHFSSGMYMRLAFAVAAHLDQEILLVDEVLAVGDVAFQKKCINKVSNISQSGRTVLFVSHNMEAVSQLCRRVILLEGGRVESDGPTEETLRKYLWGKVQNSGEYFYQPDQDDNPPTELMIRSVAIKNSAGVIAESVDSRQPFSFKIEYEVFERLEFGWVGFVISSANGVVLLCGIEADQAEFAGPREPGVYRATVTIPARLFNTGNYLLTVLGAKKTAGSYTILHELTNILSFQVQLADIGSDFGGRVGVMYPSLEWRQSRC